MSRHEDQEVDPLDVDSDETKLDRHGKKEGYLENIKTEEDDDRKETEEANYTKETSSSERHEELKERDTSPPGNRSSIHAHNTADAELEETRETIETDRDKQPVVHATGDQASLTNKAEDGAKTDVGKTPTGGHSDERKDEAKPEKAKRDSWRQKKSQPEVPKKPKEMNGEGHHGTHGRSLTPAAPKKVADKVHSIIEDYTTKMKSAGSRPETADRTPVRVGSFRGSESEPKGNISEIRARIERSASSVSSRPPPRRSIGPGGTRDAESIDEGEAAALEAKRKKKAEDWLSKVVKPADGGSHGAPDRSGPLSPPAPGKAQTSTWKKRELELKKEREEKEAAQKQLDEKKKKLDEERRVARETARKLKEQDDATKREQQRNSTATTPTTTTERPSLSHHKYNAKDAEKTSRSVQSPGIRTAPLIKSLSVSSEDEKLKKQKAIESRLKPLNLNGLDKDELEKKAHELYERVRKLEEDKYDLQILLEKRESELNELKVKTGDAKGKFVKPQLKKVIKKDEGATHQDDDVCLSTKLKTDDDDESKIKTTTDEYLTRMTSSDPDGRQDEVTNHEHSQPALGHLLQTAEC